MKTISLQDPSKLNETNVESKHLLVEDAVADAFFLLIIVRIVEPFWYPDRDHNTIQCLQHKSAIKGRDSGRVREA